MTKKRKALNLSDTKSANTQSDSQPITEEKTKSRPHSTTVYLPKDWHVLLKKEAAVSDGERVNDYFLEGLKLFFKERGIAFIERS